LLLHAQPDDSSRFTTRLLENRYDLSIRNGQFAGAGAPLLRSAIAQSRFVLVGEEHGFAETPLFWTGVCNAAGPEGFHTMAIEEGPLVAASLERWAGLPDGLAELAAFEKQYPESVQIYNTREEFEMLQRCAQSAHGGRFRLWGLNQEALGAAGLILSRILDTSPGAESRAAIEELLRKNDEAYAKALETGRMSNLFILSADDKDLAAGAAVLEKDGSPQAQSLFRSLIESHEINKAWPASAERRSRMMKMLFAARYAEAARSEASPPKVLLKFGAYHLFRGLNPLHASGIGNYVAEFADGLGAQSLHIYVMAVKGSHSFYPKYGQPAQLRPFDLKDDPRSRYLQPMLANLLESGWTMYDLRPLRPLLNGPPGSINADLANLISGMDILVMASQARPATLIR